MKKLLRSIIPLALIALMCISAFAEGSQPIVLPSVPLDSIIKYPVTTETAKEIPQSFRIDGKDVSVTTYALVDKDGGVTNYIKARDLANLINGTQGNFSIDYIDGKVTFASKTKYTPNGSEGSTPFHGDRTATHQQLGVVIDGANANLDALSLYDDNGGGYTYFKIRDLGKSLGFNVTWDGIVVIETDKPYTG